MSKCSIYWLSAIFFMLSLVFAIVLVGCSIVESEVEFVVDGSIYAIIRTKGNEVLKMPNDPEKDGYVFDGWYWDKDSWKKPFTANSLLDAPLSGNMSVYAKWTTTEGINGTEVELDGFELIDDKSLGIVYYTCLPNFKLIYSMSDAVKVNSQSTWSISSDISGNLTIESKTVALAEGNNTYYLLVKDNKGNVKQYTVLIRRRPMYTVVYKSNYQGSVYSTERVEEGYLGNPPEITKTGYHLVSWTYDFSKPIVENVLAVAQYVPNTYHITYNANGGTISQINQDVDYDSNITMSIPQRAGYMFEGWYCNNQLVEDGKWNIAEDVTLIAHWSAVRNRIIYDLDGGQNNTLNPGYYYTGTTVMLSDPTKIGYIFLGWSEGTSDLVKNPKIESNDFGTKKFIAHWEANTYRVAFDSNGGYCEQSNLNYVFGQYYELPVPTRNGYEFSGWYYNSVNFKSGCWNLAEDCTLFATWIPLKYSINYILNGGVNSSDNALFYTIESEISLQSPTREGYSFDGWTLDGNEIPVVGLKIEKGSLGAKTFTAHWCANTYTLRLDANGGVCDIETQDVAFDKAYRLPVPQRVGYSFDGWYLGSQKIVSNTWNFAQNCTFVARWSANQDTGYTVRHWQQNVIDDNYSLFDEQNLTGISDSYIVPKTNSYEGFSSPSNQTVSIAPDGSLVVDYFYKRNSYTVSFVTNGGEPLAPITQKYQSELNIPSGSRSGYTFGGWFEDFELSEEYDDVFMTSTNKTVYAWWREENKPTDFTYSIAENCTIDSYKGTSITMWIPSFIGGYTVQEIKASAFSNKLEVKKVVVPDSVIRIGLGAFKGCNSIEEMVLPFVGGSYTSKDYKAVFGYIFGYETAVVGSDWFSPRYTYYYDATTGEKVRSWDTKTKIDNTMVNFRAGSSTEMYSPSDAIWQYSCYNAQHPMGGDCYFMRCYYYGIPVSIKNVTITVQTDIPVAAFNNCDFIQSVILPENTQSIGEYAFQNCNGLMRLNSKVDGELNVPCQVSDILEYAFWGCGGAVNVKTGSLLTVNAYAFANCNNVEKFNSDEAYTINIAGNVDAIGDYAFSGLSLIKNVVVSNEVKSIGLGAFKGCNSIENIALPFVGASAKAEYCDAVFGYIFGYNSFREGSYKWESEYTEADKMYINQKYGELDGVWQYTGYTYSYTNAYGTKYYKESRYYCIPNTIKNVTITVQTDIPVAAFNNCDFIQSVILPENTQSIGEYAFQNCTATIIYVDHLTFL